MAVKYAINNLNENMAKASGRNLSISTKHSVEICNNIRGKSLQKAKALLEKVIKKESPIKMTRYMKDTAHKRGIGAGRYPINATKGILSILESAEANAQNKGLSTKDMVLFHISAHKASTPWHYGRQRRRKMKRTHIQVVLMESKKKTETEKKKTETKEIKK
jgi:large subunit ribosomal protein L22